MGQPYSGAVDYIADQDYQRCLLLLFMRAYDWSNLPDQARIAWLRRRTLDASPGATKDEVTAALTVAKYEGLEL